MQADFDAFHIYLQALIEAIYWFNRLIYMISRIYFEGGRLLTVLKSPISAISFKFNFMYSMRIKIYTFKNILRQSNSYQRYV